MKPTRIHLLTQFAWPDAAPTGLLAEQLADHLRLDGWDTVLVAGVGSYRPSDRPSPATPIVRLKHRSGRRGSLVSSALEFFAVTNAFRTYIQEQVFPGDIVLMTSAPPNTVQLADAIHARDARAVYWLQDYYPELLRTLWDYPEAVRAQFCRRWDAALSIWDVVVKAAGNLGYTGPNTRTIRNWPTMDLGRPEPSIPRTALYSGNLGYCHHLPSFLGLCEELRAEKYVITVRGDGVGRAKLPDWVRVEPAVSDLEALRRSYWQAEVHLIAAHPIIRGAVFPSKFWNSHATGREIRTSGFAGEMLEELREIRRAGGASSLPRWAEVIEDLAGYSPAAVAGLAA